MVTVHGILKTCIISSINISLKLRNQCLCSILSTNNLYRSKTFYISTWRIFISTICKCASTHLGLHISLIGPGSKGHSESDRKIGAALAGMDACETIRSRIYYLKMNTNLRKKLIRSLNNTVLGYHILTCTRVGIADICYPAR